MKDETIQKRLGLNEAELKELRQAARQTWGAIACDIFDALGKDAIRRSHVIEIVLDANHIEIHGAPYGRGRDFSPAVKAALNYSSPTHDYNALKAALATEFCAWEGL
jgi:hypothetical protein